MTNSPDQREIRARMNRYQTLLGSAGLDGAILVQRVDLYYFSGTDQDAHLWIPARGEPLLMVRKSFPRAKEDCLLDHVVPLAGLSTLPECIAKHTSRALLRVGLEMDILPAKFFEVYRNLFPATEWFDISSMVRGLRMVKSPYEMDCIRRAARMADTVYEKIPDLLKLCNTETDLALQLEAHYRSLGHPGFVRTRTFNMECLYGQVMSGPHATVPSNSPGPTGGQGFGPFCSQGAGKGQIRRGEPVIVDYAGNVEGYIADQARIFTLGPLPEKFHRVHRTMMDIQDAVARHGRPGTKAADLYDLALEMADKAGLATGFMGFPDPVPFVAHGVGLEIDEWPVIGKGNPTVLEKGMVLALEPKFVFPSEGVVGIENTFIVAENGMEKLNRFPDEICIV